MTSRIRDLVEAPWFGHAITVAILVAAIVVGLETSPSMVARWGGSLHLVNDVILWVFVAEAVAKIVAYRFGYFKDPWNLFDFGIVAVCFLPIDAGAVAVLRLARLLRVLKLVRALPQLQVLVGALLRSVPSMGYVALLLSLLFYVYAVAGVFLFGENDPVYFGHLPIAMLSLFRIVTGEGWSEIMYIEMWGCGAFGYDDWPGLCVASKAQPVLAATYFVTFMLLGAMVILNLFIGVIMNGMDEARKENAAVDRQIAEASGRLPTVDSEVDEILEELGRLRERVSSLADRLAEERKR